MQPTRPSRGASVPATQFIATLTLSGGTALGAAGTSVAPLRLRRDSLAEALHALGQAAQRWGTTGTTRVVRASVVEVDATDRPVRAYDLDGSRLPAAA